MQNSASVCSEKVSEILLIVVGVVRVMSVFGDDVLFFIYDFHTACSLILRGKTNWNVHVFISMIVWLAGLNIKIPSPPKKSRAHPIFQYSLKPSNNATFCGGRPSPSCKSKNPTRILPTLVSTKTCQPFWPPKQIHSQVPHPNWFPNPLLPCLLGSGMPIKPVFSVKFWEQKKNERLLMRWTKALKSLLLWKSSKSSETYLKMRFGRFYVALLFLMRCHFNGIDSIYLMIRLWIVGG